MSKFFHCGVFAMTLLLSGCTTVKPWERGILAKPHMALEPSPGYAQIMQHSFFSKEAITGGAGLGGSGCGCN